MHLGKEENRKCNPSAEMGPGVNAGPLHEDRCGKKNNHVQPTQEIETPIFLD